MTFFCTFSLSSEIAASCSSLAQNFMLPASSDSQSLPHIIPTLRGSGVVSPFQHPPLQPNNIPINPNLHQPPISTFLHQFEQFANNKNVSNLTYDMIGAYPFFPPSPTLLFAMHRNLSWWILWMLHRFAACMCACACGCECDLWYINHR